MRLSDQDRNTAEARDRKIIHIYASVVQRDNPDFRGKPVAVGRSRERGVVAAASYEARKFGVRSAMPPAKRQCPDLIFVKPRFEVYEEISRHIRTIFAEHTEIIEPLSLDEAYLDVTENNQEAVLGQVVTIREGRTERRATATEAFLLKLAKRGIEGDSASAPYIAAVEA